MNLGLRAILYTVRKWKKTLLVFFLLLAITTLVLSGLAIADAQEEQAEEVRGTTGASFTVERNLSTGGWANDSDGTYSTQELITKDMIQKIASVEGITGYDASNGGVPTLYDEEGNNLSLSPDGFAYYAYGAYNSEFNSLFVSGRFELVEGSHITEDVTDGIILSRESVEKNGLKIGDKITGIINPEYNDPEVEMELIGVFDIVADKDDTINMYDASTYWDYNQYAFCSNSVMEALAVNYSDDGIERAFFYVEDAAQLDNVIKNVQHIDSINWNNFIITANDEVYQNISSALSDTGTLITTLYHCHNRCEHGSDYPDPLHVHPQPETGNRHFTGGGYRQACGDSPICAGNPTDRGGGLSAGLPIQQAGCRCPGYAVRQGGGECHRHTGAFHAGGYRGRYPAGGGGAGVQYFSLAVKAQADFGADGVKEGEMI